MLDLLAGFVGELRAAGLPVSLTENVDAMQAIVHVPLDDRQALRVAMAATLVKRAEHRLAFDAVFESYFSVAPGADGADAGGLDVDLASLLDEALRSGDEDAVRRVARQAVARLAGMEAGRGVRGSAYVFQTLRLLDLDGALARLLAGAGWLERDDLMVGARRVREEVEAEVRRRLVADRGPQAVARSVRRPLPEDVDFLHASRDDLAALHRSLRPLARRMAARLARRRRQGRHGRLDFRRTLRRSLSTGGVPADPTFRRPHPHKPEIVVLADVSGSVATFARFTLQLVHALAGEFSAVRTFVFIDGIDEVTRLFTGTDDLAEALARVNAEADVVAADGHSDYGRALASFWTRWGREVGPRTSVVVLGDARNNYHAANAWVLGELQRRARRVWWLNPEPRSYWDTGDSIVSEYGAQCDGVFECRNLRQLEGFVARIT
ncbi:MAG TPA: VWA domain-containing protein [Acidimicrobiales bacterium]|nr:VWA domain-containing protein [Acidimicrobiales bacterium]